jgi:hypothetical protein
VSCSDRVETTVTDRPLVTGSWPEYIPPVARSTFTREPVTTNRPYGNTGLVKSPSWRWQGSNGTGPAIDPSLCVTVSEQDDRFRCLARPFAGRLDAWPRRACGRTPAAPRPCHTRSWPLTMAAIVRPGWLSAAAQIWPSGLRLPSLGLTTLSVRTAPTELELNSRLPDDGDVDPGRRPHFVEPPVFIAVRSCSTENLLFFFSLLMIVAGPPACSHGGPWLALADTPCHNGAV